MKENIKNISVSHLRKNLECIQNSLRDAQPMSVDPDTINKLISRVDSIFSILLPFDGEKILGKTFSNNYIGYLGDLMDTCSYFAGNQGLSVDDLKLRVLREESPVVLSKLLRVYNEEIEF